MDDFELALDSYRDAPVKARHAVYVDYSDWSDAELIDVPAHVLASRIRMAAMGGRKLEIADPASTVDAAVRIKEEDSNTLDFHPRFTWNNVMNNMYMDMDEFQINDSLVGAAIPPRVGEPRLPDRTRVSTVEVVGSAVATNAFEKCVIAGYTALQVVEKAGGDAEELAACMNKVWGGANVFHAGSRADFIGDTSYTRYLARATKRRFQLYRNISWLSVVTAGLSNASPDSYGNNVLVNWQRRAELAASYIHIAQELESDKYPVGVVFGIHVRVPAFAVTWGTWEDCAIFPDSSVVKLSNIPNSLVALIEEVSTEKMGDILIKISSTIRTANRVLEEDPMLMNLATTHDRLVYVSEFKHTDVKIPTGMDKKLELTYGARVSVSTPVQGTFKSHDMPTALIEALTNGLKSVSLLTLDATSITGWLGHISILADYIHPNKRLDYVLSLVPFFRKYYVICAAVLNQIFKGNPSKLKKNYQTAVITRYPSRLVEIEDPMESLCAITFFEIMSDPNSKASRSVNYWESQIKQELDRGIRMSKSLLVSPNGQMQITIANSIHKGTITVYNNRYRARAHMYDHASVFAASEINQNALKLEAVKWFLLADMFAGTSIKILNQKVIVELDNTFNKKALNVAASKMGRIYKIPVPETKNLDVIQTIDILDRTFNMPIIGIKKSRWQNTIFRSIYDHTVNLAKIHEQDFLTDIVIQPPEVQKDRIDYTQVFKLIETATVTIDTVEDAVAKVLQVSGYAEVIDEDDIDQIIEMLEGQLSADESRKQSFIDTCIMIESEKDAKEKVDKWINMIRDQSDDEDEGKDIL